MTTTSVADSLNISQLRSLDKMLKDNIENVTYKHSAVAFALIDNICEKAKDENGDFQPVIIETTPIRNIFDIEGEDNNVISMR